MKKDNCWSEQSPKKIDCSVFWGATQYTFKSLITTSQMSLFHLLCGPLSNWLDFKKFRDISGLRFSFLPFLQGFRNWKAHLYKTAVHSLWQYAVKVRRHMPWSRVRCHGSHACWFTHRQFHSQLVMREPRNRDNGASDVWALTAYSALLVLNGTSLNCNNALVALNWRFVILTGYCNQWSW